MPSFTRRDTGLAGRRRFDSSRLAAPVNLLALLSLEPLVWKSAQVFCGDLSDPASTTPRSDPSYLILLQRRTVEVHTNWTPYMIDRRRRGLRPLL